MTNDHTFWLGIDFGAKLAGTTAICYMHKKKLMFQQTTKKQDADLFLIKTIRELNPTHIFIDAPLSLPGKYSSNGDDYFFRACDKLVNAMSPMFIGGLTARAIKLKDSFSNVNFIEAYPSYLAKHKLNSLLPGYRTDKSSTTALESLEKITGSNLVMVPENTHQLDALLCWTIGKRYFQNEAERFGNEQEGLIWV